MASNWRDFCLTEEESQMLRGTRMFEKRRKNWKGKKEPKDEWEVLEVGSIRNPLEKPNLKNECPYCKKKYFGDWLHHEPNCYPPPQKLKDCSQCGKENVPIEHICGQKDTYYDLDEEGHLDSFSIC
jgi:hypothetical protein